MKPVPLILTVAAAALASLPSLRAQAAPAAPTTPKPVSEAPKPEAPTPPRDAPKPPAGKRAEALKQLDKDGDGTVSPEERKAAGENARKKMLERFDQDGDGQLSAAERQAADADREAKMLARFDADGDGALSADERKAARQGQPKPAPPTTLPGRKGKADGKPLRLELRPRIMERFDKDGDGQLSDAERAAARDALKARKTPKPAQ